MKKLLNLSIFIILILFIQGCSNSNSFNSEELKKLVSSVHYDNLEKVEFNKENNELKISILDEFINNSDAEIIIDKIKINNLSGKDSLKSSNFKGKKINISILSTNKNEILIIDNDVENYKLNINIDKYSKEYVKRNLSKLSKSIVSFNTSIGAIELNLKKGNISKEVIEKFNKDYNNLINDLEYSKPLIKNSEFNNNHELNEKIELTRHFLDILYSAAQYSISLKQHYQIESKSLSVNELDKISRYLNLL